ncbi:hypothetical protein AX17_006119 [Amanita inopinata Kibby_2008]|nr:hypothetical protein AX17_006119 [Amanita inopinata Kibby_2008]
MPHPNAWDDLQQRKLRRAAFHAGLIDDENSPDLLFVTDGEAVLHYCISQKHFQFIDKEGALIVSAGAGFANFSAFSKTSNTSRFEEIIAAQTILSGSSFVTDGARNFITYWFRDCRFSGDSDFIAQRFDKTVKLQFHDDGTSYYIQFASSRDNDPDLNVRSGKFKIEGQQIADFFKPSVNNIISMINELRNTLGGENIPIILVGGFGENNWLLYKIRSAFNDSHIYRLENGMLNAVADGAVHFYLHHYVASRITRYTYGVKSSIKYDEYNPEHLSRASSKEEQYDGTVVLPNAFDIILPKNTQVLETKEFRRRYHIKSLNRSGLYRRRVQLLCYKGDQVAPRWTDDEPELFEPINIVEADMAGLANTLMPRIGPGNRAYYALKHEVVLTFGALGSDCEHASQINLHDVLDVTKITEATQESTQNFEHTLPRKLRFPVRTVYLNEKKKASYSSSTRET